MGFRAQGEGRALRVITQAGRRFRIALVEASNMAGQVMVRTVQEGMANGPHSGRTYGGHQASAPGEYPAVWKTGQLIGSIGYEVSGSDHLFFGTRGAFNRGFDYALHHHERTGRPFLTKAVNETSAEVQQLLGQVTFRKMIGR